MVTFSPTTTKTLGPARPADITGRLGLLDDALDLFRRCAVIYVAVGPQNLARLEGQGLRLGGECRRGDSCVNKRLHEHVPRFMMVASIDLRSGSN